jgi:drug/metabolite transporter (DMT)-like permease
MLWALFTVLAAAGQTLRNATQRDLIARVGVVGATHVRFLFGFPFALLFLGAMRMVSQDALPALSWSLLPSLLAGTLAQIGATALMLQAMRSKSFVVTTAYTKTEPVLVALFGLIFLGDALSWGMALAILVATCGVVLTAWPKTSGDGISGWSFPAFSSFMKALSSREPATTSLKNPLVLGIASAALFAISAIGFRASIHGLPSGGYGIRASTILVLGLGLQAFLLSAFLLITDRPALVAILRHWKPSLFAGFMGALASQFWFLGFALAAAQVRTLALIEVFFARLVSGKLFSERPSSREGLGLVLIVIGVVLLLNL